MRSEIPSSEVGDPTLSVTSSREHFKDYEALKSEQSAHHDLVSDYDHLAHSLLNGGGSLNHRRNMNKGEFDTSGEVCLLPLGCKDDGLQAVQEAMLASLSERATKLHAASSCSENVDDGDGRDSHNFSIDDVTDEGEECVMDPATTSAENKNSSSRVASSSNL